MSGKLSLVVSLEIEFLALVWDDFLTKLIAPLNVSFLKYKTKELFIMVIFQIYYNYTESLWTYGPTVAKTLVIEIVIQ